MNLTNKTLWLDCVFIIQGKLTFSSLWCLKSCLMLLKQEETKSNVVFHLKYFSVSWIMNIGVYDKLWSTERLHEAPKYRPRALMWCQQNWNQCIPFVCKRCTDYIKASKTDCRCVLSDFWPLEFTTVSFILACATVLHSITPLRLPNTAPITTLHPVNTGGGIWG